MKKNARIRLWFGGALAVMSGSLAVVTLLWNDWIEAFTGFDLDRYDGSLELRIVAGLAVGSVVAALAARAQWRRLRATAVTSRV